VPGHAELGRQLTAGQHRIAGPQPAVGDRISDLVVQLRAQRAAIAAINEQVHGSLDSAQASRLGRHNLV